MPSDPLPSRRAHEPAGQARGQDPGARSQFPAPPSRRRRPSQAHDAASTSSGSPFLGSPPNSVTGSIVPRPGQLPRHSESYSSSTSQSTHVLSLPTASPVTLSHGDAVLVHHFAEHLGRWLDCTNASRPFTRRVPVLARHCPILRNAVLAFAARHRRDISTSDITYQRCVAHLIHRLSVPDAIHDDSVLCAIVILRFYEQMSVSLGAGSDLEQHLSGMYAVLQGTQGRFIDLTAPTLRDAAFWVYVRQCLYTSASNRQPPNIDFTLQLHPIPPPTEANDPLSEISRETAWTNKITWICASVLHFCFDGVEMDPISRMRSYQELWEDLESWQNERPATFNPIWSSPPGETSGFSEIYFTADWHGKPTAYRLCHYFLTAHCSHSVWVTPLFLPPSPD